MGAYHCVYFTSITNKKIRSKQDCMHDFQFNDNLNVMLQKMGNKKEKVYVCFCNLYKMKLVKSIFAACCNILTSQYHFWLFFSNFWKKISFHSLHHLWFFNSTEHGWFKMVNHWQYVHHCTCIEILIQFAHMHATANIEMNIYIHTHIFVWNSTKRPLFLPLIF